MAKHNIIVPANFVKAAASFASKDASRPILTGVHFFAEDGKLVLACTDSYKLIVCETGCTVDDFEPFTLPAKTLAGVKTTKVQYEGGFTQGYIVEVDADNFNANVTGDCGRTFTSMRLIEGKYPNVRQLLPIGGESFTVEPTCVNPALLADACKALTVIDKNARITLATRKLRGNVVECKGDGYKVTVIVMPCTPDYEALSKYEAAPKGDEGTAKKLADAAARIAELEGKLADAATDYQALKDERDALVVDLARETARVNKMGEELADAHADGARHEWESPTCYWYDHEVEGARLCKKGKNKGNWWIKKTA